MAKEKAESQVCGSLPWGLCSKSLTDRFSYLSSSLAGFSSSSPAFIVEETEALRSQNTRQGRAFKV